MSESSDCGGKQLFDNLSNGRWRSHQCQQWNGLEGSFINYVDQILPNFNHLPLSSANCGNFMYFLPFRVTKREISIDHLPTSSYWRSYWMAPWMVVVWGLHHLVIWVFVECRQESKPQQHMCAISSSILHGGWKGYQVQEMYSQWGVSSVPLQVGFQ